MRYLAFVLVLFLFLAGCDALNPKPATIVSCNDSDGENANVKGTVSLELSDKTKKTKQDECFSSDSVREAICPKSSLEISTRNVVCPSGSCVDGVCTEKAKTTPEKPDTETKEQVTVVSCNDSDGEDANVKGSVTIELSDGTKKTKEDQCYSSDTLDEAVCPKSGINLGVRKIICTAGPCVDGVCTTKEKKTIESGYDYSLPPPSSGPRDEPATSEPEVELTVVSCNDSDGEDKYTKGSVTFTMSDGSTKTEEDMCASLYSVREAACPKHKSISCGLGYECHNGICEKLWEAPRE